MHSAHVTETQPLISRWLRPGKRPRTDQDIDAVASPVASPGDQSCDSSNNGGPELKLSDVVPRVQSAGSSLLNIDDLFEDGLLCDDWHRTSDTVASIMAVLPRRVRNLYLQPCDTILQRRLKEVLLQFSQQGSQDS